MPRKTLLKHELKDIADELKAIDLDVIQEQVVREVEKKQRIHVFIDRKALKLNIFPTKGDETLPRTEVATSRFLLAALTPLSAVSCS